MQKRLPIYYIQMFIKKDYLKRKVENFIWKNM
jgi:hypothetical protein